MENWTSSSTKDYYEALADFLMTEQREIQKKFDFEIPGYVLEEIVFTQGKQQKDNLSTIINVAVINNRIKKKDADELKREYCR